MSNLLPLYVQLDKMGTAEPEENTQLEIALLLVAILGDFRPIIYLPLIPCLTWNLRGSKRNLRGSLWG